MDKNAFVLADNQTNANSDSNSSSSPFFNYSFNPDDVDYELSSTRGPKSHRADPLFNVFLVGGYMVIIIIGITANLMVLMVALNNQRRRIGNRALCTMNTYIINLASADLLYIFGGIFWAIANNDPRGWMFGELGCRAVVSLDVITMHAGSYILTTMTIERYIAIVYPMTSFRIRNITFAQRICTGIWLSAVCLAIPVITGVRLTTVQIREKPVQMCGDFIYDRRHYYMSVCIITFVIPSIIMLIVYTKMFLIICSTVQHSALKPGNKVTKQLKKSSRRAAKIVFLIVSVYWSCYTPFWLTQVLWMYASTLEFLEGNILGLVTLFLSYLNSVVNPFIYTLLPPKHNLCSWIRSKHRKPTHKPVLL
ncbi:urotensin-2 receptor-like [Amphiura filiformis]|uniref:urotensin-2 receptor-like n=1 Tax=Amphiura filiformis TaxID=82378 RepID=UPI003B210C27